MTRALCVHLHETLYISVPVKTVRMTEDDQKLAPNGSVGSRPLGIQLGMPSRSSPGQAGFVGSSRSYV